MAVTLLSIILLPSNDGTLTPPALSLTAREVNHIKIIRNGGDDVIELHRTGQRWHMKQPLVFEANGVKAQAIADIADLPAPRRYPLTQISTKALGLDPPQIVLKLNGQRLMLGNTDPIEGLRYLRRAGDVLLIPDLLTHHLRGEPESYATLLLLPAGAQISRLQIGELTIEERAGHWHWQPQEAFDRADGAVKLIQLWQSASALNVESISKASPSDIPIILRASDGAVIEFAANIQGPSILFKRQSTGIQYRLLAKRGALLLHRDPAASNSAASNSSISNPNGD